MIEGPIIRVEMEGLRASVMHYMQRHNDDFNEMVQSTLENTLTEEWVRKSIQQAVNKTVQDAIDKLGDNWQLRNAVNEALAKALSQMIEGA
jgi:hypothetical protein